MNLFPYESVREGQREFMGDVDIATENEKHLVAHAPAGIGKTAAVVSPALEHALNSGSVVFFLTPKHTQHIIVVETLQRIKRKFNTRFVVVDIIGKQWMCPHKVRNLDSKEFNEFCRARKRDETCRYYNNVHRKTKKGRVKEVVGKIKDEPMHNEKILSLCARYELCPYEICTIVGRDASIIVCDYFHLFSPNVRKAFLKKLNKDMEGSVIIVDEAHNLPERVRKLLSVNLTEYTIRMASKEARTLGYRNIVDDLKDVMVILKELGEGMKRGDEKNAGREEFSKPLAERTKLSYNEFLDQINDLGDEVLSIPNRYRSYAKTIARFLESWKGQDLGYVRILDKIKGLRLSYRCLDPSISATDVFNVSHSTILMSGTLVPLSMYTNILGLDPDRTIEKMYESPFPRENRLLLLVPKLTTKYSKRSELMYRQYARALKKIIENVPGNVAVFFPAYHILESIGKEMKTFNLKKPLIVERKEMKKLERVRLYDTLINNDESVLMGVQAGSFSEGVDYPENLLDAVVIVGLPLGKPDLEINALIDYYDFKFERGWDYGYTYPAMNRALQAAGRCIRSETDRGAVILMDERFRWVNYRKCFPADYEFIVTETPEKYLKRFFR